MQKFKKNINFLVGKEKDYKRSQEISISKIKSDFNNICTDCDVVEVARRWKLRKIFKNEGCS